MRFPLDTFYYVPNTASCRKFIEDAFSNQYSNYKGFKTEDDLEKYLRQKSILHSNSIEAVIFSEWNPNSTVLKYKLRTCCVKFETSKLYRTLDEVHYTDSIDERYRYYFSPYSLSTNFIDIQKNIDLMFVKLHANTIQKKEILENLQFLLQSMPYPSYDNVIIYFSNFRLIPFGMVISFLLIFPMIAKRIVEEKCTRMKFLLQSMPYPSYDNVIIYFSNFRLIPFGMVISFLLIFPMIAKRIVEEKCTRMKK
ncbi:uncharacterized protein LOC111631101 [Centruroides sculpturatus]|uniref:uncharacterized protein LOC111631101 n=1 Tax=Centruroides sculpturatus TaxID=218467 RepID=UPI000C6DE4E2|nr:uncharacterized protein LOC111631101 [Centruroides sculpturatus]